MVEQVSENKSQHEQMINSNISPIIINNTHIIIRQELSSMLDNKYWRNTHNVCLTHQTGKAERLLYVEAVIRIATGGLHKDTLTNIHTPTII